MIPLLSKNFSIPEHFWNTRALLRIFLVLWDKKIRSKIVIPSYPPLSCPYNFSMSKFPETQKAYPTKFYGRVRQKNSDGRTLYPPPPLSRKVFTTSEKFWNTEGSPTIFFGFVRLKIFDLKSWYPPFMQEYFRHSNFFETLKGSPRNFLALWGKKIRQNRDTPIIHKSSDTRSFLKHKCPPTKFFVTVRLKNFDEKSW